MLEFNCILLATDFSASAAAALQYAALLARLSHATLQVCHVIDTRVVAFAHWTDVFRSTEVLAARETTATAALQEWLAHPALTGLAVEPRLQYGHPGDAIIDAALHVDLVVLGTRGMTTAPGLTPGKMARQVAHASPTPVLLVPAGCQLPATSATAPPTLPIQRILLALHVAQYAPQAVALSYELATACHASLDVLQVLAPEHLRASRLDVGAGLSHNLESTRALLYRRLEEIVPDVPAGPKVERLVATGTPAESILQQASERHADLLVMSVHAYGALQKLFTPSTVDTVMAQTTCPLLAVPFPPVL